jgi:hypothetical protein
MTDTPRHAPAVATDAMIDIMNWFDMVSPRALFGRHVRNGAKANAQDTLAYALTVPETAGRRGGMRNTFVQLSDALQDMASTLGPGRESVGNSLRIAGEMITALQMSIAVPASGNGLRGERIDALRGPLVDALDALGNDPTALTELHAPASGASRLADVVPYFSDYMLDFTGVVSQGDQLDAADSVPMATPSPPALGSRAPAPAVPDLSADEAATKLSRLMSRAGVQDDPTTAAVRLATTSMQAISNWLVLSNGPDAVVGKPFTMDQDALAQRVAYGAVVPQGFRVPASGGGVSERFDELVRSLGEIAAAVVLGSETSEADRVRTVSAAEAVATLHTRATVPVEAPEARLPLLSAGAEPAIGAFRSLQRDAEFLSVLGVPSRQRVQFMDAASELGRQLDRHLGRGVTAEQTAARSGPNDPSL